MDTEKRFRFFDNTLLSIFELMLKPGLATDPKEREKVGRSKKEQSEGEQPERKEVAILRTGTRFDRFYPCLQELRPHFLC